MKSPGPAAAMIALVAFTLTACGANVQQEVDTPTGEPVTVTNCGAPLTVDGIPERVVTNDTGITELMFALGLADRIVGYGSYPSKERDIATSPWRADFETTPSLGNDFTREIVQAADPDFVFAGWNYGFRESTGLTPDWVRSLGAAPYVLTEACRQPGTDRRGVMAPLDALHEDLANLGDIFGVRAEADALIAGYRDLIATAGATIPSGQEPARVFLFDSATPEPFTSGRHAAPAQIIREAGGTNIFDDLNDSWTSASWEAAAQRDPQAILIVDYGAGPENSVAAKIASLHEHPLMSGTTAVREGNFFALPYAALVEGPRNPQAVVDVAEFLRSKGY